MTDKRVFLYCLCFSLLGTLAALVIPYVNTDEGAWASMAQHAFSGELYHWFTDHKPPGLYQVYWLFSLGSQSSVAVHWFGSLWTGLGGFFLFLILKNYFSFRAAMCSGLLYSGLNGLVNLGSFSPERIYLSFLILAFWLSMQVNIKASHRALGVGLLVGYAACIKQPAVVLGLMPVGMLLYWNRSLLNFSLIFLGGLFATFVSWWISGVEFSTIWIEAYWKNFSYVDAPGVESSSVVEHLKNASLVVGLYFLPATLGAFLSFPYWIRRKRVFFVLAIFLILSLIPVVLGGRFYQNYFQNLLPFLIVASTPFWESSLRKHFFSIFVILIVALNVRVLWMQYSDQNKNWDSKIKNLIAQIKEDTEESDRIWVSHNLFSVYYETHRYPATPLIFFHHVLHYVDICRVDASYLHEDKTNQQYQSLVRDLHQHRPRVIFWTQRGVNSCTDRLHLEDFPSIKNWIESHYELSYQDELGTYYLWRD